MDLRRVFEPETIAVVGVSLTNDLHPANVIFSKNLLRYPVTVYPVNPKGGMLQGQHVYAGIADIPGRIDLAVIAVKAELVPAVLSQCFQAGVGGAVIISGGFSESGNSAVQDEITAMAREASFPFLGPNCLGIFSPERLDTLFLPSERIVRPPPGNVALVSQSGGILVDQMLKFAGEGIGLSLGVSIGNKACIDETMLLDYLIHDRKTSVIAFYTEGFGRNKGRDFVLKAGRSPKPVIMLKAGRTERGMKAVASHTASLAGDYAVFSSVLAQHGVIEAHNESELISFCEVLSCYQVGIGGKIGVITGSGGHGALAIDHLSASGLEAPELSPAVQKEIRSKLSPSIQNIASLANPIDLTGSAVDHDFVVVVDELSRLPDIDCLLVLLLPYLPGSTSDLSARISMIARQAGKPLIAYVPHVEKYRMLIEGFELNRVPVSPSVEGAVQMTLALKRCPSC